MAITLKELDSTDFPEAGKRDRGYVAEAVDAFKARVRAELVEAYTQLQDVEQELGSVRQQLVQAQNDVAEAQRALAERPAVVDHTTAVATQSAELLARAEALANEHVHNAEVTANARIAQADEVLRRAEAEATAHAEARLAEVREKTNALVSSKKQEFAEVEAAVNALRHEEEETRSRLRDYFTARLEELGTDSNNLPAGE